MAESRRDSSNRSVTNVRNWPRSPRNFSRVRGRRPSPSAKFWRSIEVEGRTRPLAGCLGLAQEPLELAPDDIHIERHTCVLEGRQADPQRTLEECHAVLLGPLGHERGKVGVDEDEALHGHPVSVHPDDAGTAIRGGEWDKSHRFHALTIAQPCAS